MTKVLRVYHAAAEEQGQGRLTALRAAGCDVYQVVPSRWGGGADGGRIPVDWIRLPVDRPGDVNRHRYREPRQLVDVVREVRPDLLDLHEEPFSLSARQWLRAAGDIPVVMYTAQNLDKRFPPPFHHYEQAAFRQVAGFYPCSRQAASVIRGKGYAGPVQVLPLGFDDEVFGPGDQSLDDDPLVLTLVGRLVPEKGVRDAVHVLHAVRQERKARLLIVGSGPEKAAALQLAAELGLSDDVELRPWTAPERLADLYRRTHVLLIPSRATATWVEQFGRVIVEAQASGAVVAGYESGSIPEVTDGAGVLVPEGDVESLACAVANLTQDAPWHEALRRRGLELSTGRTWKQVAAQQAALYRLAIDAGHTHVATTGRTAAVREFGPPATALGQQRPFALPVLRRPTRYSRALAAALDLVSRTPG